MEIPTRRPDSVERFFTPCPSAVEGGSQMGKVLAGVPTHSRLSFSYFSLRENQCLRGCPKGAD